MKAKLLSNRAGCYSKLMEFSRAQKDCEEALKFKPDFVKCWIRKGAVLEAQKQLDNALESYRVSFFIFIADLYLIKFSESYRAWPERKRSSGRHEQSELAQIRCPKRSRAS